MNPVFGAERIGRFFAGILGKAAAFDPAQPVRSRIIEVNGEAAVLLWHQGRCDVLLIDGGLDGSVRELRQLANPDKLTRLSLGEP